MLWILRRARLLSFDDEYQAIEAFEDALENLRVYHTTQHVQNPNIVAAATSMGIIILNLAPLEPSGRTVGTFFVQSSFDSSYHRYLTLKISSYLASHKLWGKMILHYEEGSIHR